MKIVMFGQKAIPSRAGGIEVVVHNLATTMARGPHEVVVINRAEQDRAKKRRSRSKASTPPTELNGVRLITVPTYKKRGLAAVTASFFSTVRAITLRPDILHIHAIGPAMMTGIARAAGLRTVVTVHGLDWQRAKWGKLASLYLRAGERSAVRHADEIIVLSRNLQEYFSTKYRRDTVYIPNGIEKSSHREPQIIKERHGLAADAYLLFVGRIVPEKGLHYLVEAFRSLDTDMKLVIAGSGSDSDEYYESIINLTDRDPRIVMTGHVEGPELFELFSNSYVYILPSDVEGMPISLLEAVSYGSCCLISNIPECVEIVGDAGEVFTRGNVDELRRSLEKLISSPSLVTEKRSRTEELARSQYSWLEISDQTLELYERVIRGAA